MVSRGWRTPVATINTTITAAIATVTAFRTVAPGFGLR
jgi:hypothetical protein